MIQRSGTRDGLSRWFPGPSSRDDVWCAQPHAEHTRVQRQSEKSVEMKHQGEVPRQASPPLHASLPHFRRLPKERGWRSND